MCSVVSVAKFESNKLRCPDQDQLARVAQDLPLTVDTRRSSLRGVSRALQAAAWPGLVHAVMRGVDGALQSLHNTSQQRVCGNESASEGTTATPATSTTNICASQLQRPRAKLPPSGQAIRHSTLEHRTTRETFIVKAECLSRGESCTTRYSFGWKLPYIHQKDRMRSLPISAAERSMFRTLHS